MTCDLCSCGGGVALHLHGPSVEGRQCISTTSMRGSGTFLESFKKKKVLLRYISQTIQVIHIRCTIQ